MSRERVFEIARWEYTQKVRSKAFLVSLILFPVFIFGMSFLPQLLISDEPTEQQVVGFLEEGTTIAAAFETTMNARGAIVFGHLSSIRVATKRLMCRTGNQRRMYWRMSLHWGNTAGMLCRTRMRN